MKYAIVDEERVEALPGLRGICQCCGEETIAKCGQHVVWHWAHRSRRHCDPWWEPETEWHRSWKGRFPDDWQEIVHTDPKTDERHVADVKTSHGLVIEMQNSPLHREEMASRERFYGNMIWIVNGDRRGTDGRQETLDKTHFNMGRSSQPMGTDPLTFTVVWQGKSKLLHNWSMATKDVYFDFADGVLWKLDSFDPNKTIVHKTETSVGSRYNRQGDLFPESRIEHHSQRTVILGTFIPFRIERLVNSCNKGKTIEGTLEREEMNIFRKCMVLHSELIDNP